MLFDNRPVRTPVRPRYVGLLDANRRILAISAVAAVGGLAVVPALPAYSFATAPEPVEAGQSVARPAAIIRPIEQPRDGFGVTAFSIVQWPVPSTTPMSSGFGLRECDGCSTNHTGDDFNPGAGYPIQSVADGVVTAAGWDSTGYGNRVIVEHVIDGQTVSTLYAHMLDGSMAVAVGQTVRHGQLLGSVGSTGESTGAHLHFSVIVGGAMIDPYPWLLVHANSPYVGS